ncbi:glycosyltransferase family 2 protein [uncultured Clostridium sp.]|uniref:glycosyltransferase family 2 protein n=1 Tax=uncultured Clostridium sp. TaxID=59620 RepID=UPI00258BF70C|nr:glycosyltransferase family 2 protein [uncultured Clostridium sp.]
MNIKFSIITVCFNSDRTIERTLNSVKNQSYKNYEHIIVDGSSKDNTIQIVENYMQENKKVKFISEPDTGIYNAMNKGIKLSSGDLIVFLNSDDTFEKNALYEISKNFSEEYDLIYGDTYHIEEYKGEYYEKKVNVDNKNVVKKNEMIPHNSTFVKSDIMKNNLFDENLKICADYKFFLTMYKKKVRIKYINFRITNMLMGGISTTNLELGLKEHIMCQKEVLGKSSINFEEEIKRIKVMQNKKYLAKKFLPKKIYIKFRFYKKGWKLSRYDKK